MRVFRIAPERFALDISGEGARLNGGRWNPVGKPVLYTAESPALAMLECIAFFAVTGAPPNLILVTLEIPDDVSISRPAITDLPTDWAALPKVPSTKAFGARWIEEAAASCLQVPSVVVPVGCGWNYVLNPLHPELRGKIVVADSIHWAIDERIAKVLT